MTFSLAFLAPDLVKTAIDGRLRHGMGVARLGDLPAEWSRQRQLLGLAALNLSIEPRLCLRRSPFRETEFRAQRQLGRKRLLAIIGRCRG